MLSCCLTYPFLFLEQLVVRSRRKWLLITSKLYRTPFISLDAVWSPQPGIFLFLCFLATFRNKCLASAKLDCFLFPCYTFASLEVSFFCPVFINSSVPWISKSTLILSMRPFYNPVFMCALLNLGPSLWSDRCCPSVGSYVPSTSQREEWQEPQGSCFLDLTSVFFP